MADKTSIPQGVVALLVGPSGREIATVAEFMPSAPAGFTRRDFQESAARRALAMEAMRRLASPTLSDHIEPYTAEQIMRRMCDAGGCRTVIVPIGYED